MPEGKNDIFDRQGEFYKAELKPELEYCHKVIHGLNSFTAEGHFVAPDDAIRVNSTYDLKGLPCAARLVIQNTSGEYEADCSLPDEDCPMRRQPIMPSTEA